MVGGYLGTWFFLIDKNTIIDDLVSFFKIKRGIFLCFVSLLSTSTVYLLLFPWGIVLPSLTNKTL